ncbi:hypothetical protein SAMN05421823_10534 [Catalinimonas alkaloidigena]|uniref:Uncharacterized protein n=1 Tax=Catalinimonas alkaloidigena TaxID=1075417 RepID=A0A1G9IKX0_9BACT|nr:hypothetical protein SAMN05421823_10534 [Catalinimonas alkaloidigena]
MRIAIALCLTGTYCSFDGLGIVSSRFALLSLLIKAVFCILGFYYLRVLFTASKLSAYKLVAIAFIPFLILITGVFNYFSFFPTLETYELKVIYFNNSDKEPEEQNRIEYFEVEYGLFNTATKYERVSTFLEVFEIRKRIFPPYEELRRYKLRRFYNGYPEI